MKLQLPVHDQYDVIRLRVDTPIKELVLSFSVMYHPCVDIELPSGVNKNEVTIWGQFMNGSNPVDDEFVIQRAIAQPKEKSNEDDPDKADEEADEEAGESPPAESDHEEILQELKKPIDLSHLVRNRRLRPRK